MNIRAADTSQTVTPFDAARIDRLMDEAGIDVLFATSKHNTQYLMGGYRFIFFTAMDAIGHSRYLPIVVYEKGRPDHAAYVGNRMENGENQNHPFWTPSSYLAAWGSVDSTRLAVEHLEKAGLKGKRIGIEPGFLPSDAWRVLSDAVGADTLVDATAMLERMRAIKTLAEIETLAHASDKITDAMLATFAGEGEGSSKGDIVDRLRREETNRGLTFEYALLTIGSSHNRAVSGQTWRNGEVLSLDSGGNYRGYIGDLCRMAVLGEPDAELQDILAEIESVQQAAFGKIRAGVQGGDVIAHAESVLKQGPNAAHNDFFAHGMGLITHETPFLMTNHPVAYEGVDSARPLATNMVLSVETTMLHPSRGFIKLEDTLVVTDEGHRLLGDRGRGWNRGGVAG